MDYHWTLLSLHALLAALAGGHALLHKRDPSSAFGWIATSVMFPLAGPLLYFLFGINRVQTRARKLKQRRPSMMRGIRQKDLSRAPTGEFEGPVHSIEIPAEFTEQDRISSAVTQRSLVAGNRIDLLHNGEQAYPAMLGAIEDTQSTLYLSSYIFEVNYTGRLFIDTLSRAAERGVDVRVMIDGVGELYTLPRSGSLLKRRGVPIARFLPPKLAPPSLHINLRNHRKILVADGEVAFTGGMNIGDRHLADDQDNPSRVIDTHFRLTGPIVRQIEQVFLDDWRFATRRRGKQARESTEHGFRSSAHAGSAICRTVTDGPNEDMDKLTMILVGAVSSARKRLSIMTPYFLPPAELLAALEAAALRGVDVTVILPEKNNLPYVQWATCNVLGELLYRGVRVYYQPPPFVHTKLFMVDDHYAQIGSANLDARSLRLNFELVIEVYDKPFVKLLDAHFEQVRHRSRPIVLDDINSRSVPVRLRDAACWLFSPYL